MIPINKVTNSNFQISVWIWNYLLELQIPKYHPHKLWLIGPVVEVQFLFLSSHFYPDSDGTNTILLKILLGVLALAAHILKLERYREDLHGPCARMIRKFVKRSIFLDQILTHVYGI